MIRLSMIKENMTSNSNTDFKINKFNYLGKMDFMQVKKMTEPLKYIKDSLAN